METALKFLVYMLIGFCAQMIDGTMGMAYGVSCRTFLKTTGVPTALASALTHLSEVPTTLASGISHIKLKNVDKKLLLKLMIPGVIGGVIGAYLLTNKGDFLEPFIDAYLIVMGGIIISKAFSKKEKPPKEPGAYVYPLGLVGGFCDAAGGGGWGPIVTSTMVATGYDVKRTIGTVNTAEFVVTMAETVAFIPVLAGEFLQYAEMVLAIVIGGVIAAPLAAALCKKLPVKPLLGIVGTLIILLNIWNLLKYFGVV